MTMDVGLMVRKTTAGQDILQKRLERGDIVECGIVFTKRGINK